MGRIVFLTNLERQQTMMKRAYDALDVDERRLFVCKAMLADQTTVWNDRWRQRLADAAIVIVSWMGSGLDTEFLKQTAVWLRQRTIPHLMLVDDSQAGNPSHALTSEDAMLVRQYLAYGGLDNFRGLLLWLAWRSSGLQPLFQQPCPLPWHGIYHPQAAQPFGSIDTYWRQLCREERPTVGILFYRDEWIWGDLAYQQALIEQFERQGMNAVAVFSQCGDNKGLDSPGLADAMQAFFYRQGAPIVDVLVSSLKFSMAALGESVRSELQLLNVAVLQLYTMYRTEEQWQTSLDGLTPVEMSVSVALPEFDGVIHSGVIAGRAYGKDGAPAYAPIAERLSAIVGKARKWACLRRKANAEKKVAIIFHNYPPGNANIGSAAGLDSPQSVCRLLGKMQLAGYRLDFVPNDGETLIRRLTEGVTNDRAYATPEQLLAADALLDSSRYRQLFEGLDGAVADQLVQDWGVPPGEVFYCDGRLVIPGMMNGNVFIGLQPPRGFDDDADKLYHAPDCAPPHHYLAYYYWLRDVWQADAVIHVGTHGTLEWLPGKGAALSGRCYPDVVLGDLPNIYPYWVTVVGEGMQAKRRSSACLIGHLTPPVGQAGLYDVLLELELLLDEYWQFKQQQMESQLAVTARMIAAKVQDAQLQEEVPQLPGQAFDDWAASLHQYLADLKYMQIRTGLHVLGAAPIGDDLTEFLLALVGGGSDAASSLPQVIAAGYGYAFGQLSGSGGLLLPDGNETHGALAERVLAHSREFLNLLANCRFVSADAGVVLQPAWAAAMSHEIQIRLLAIAEFVCQTLVPALECTSDEIDNIIAALAGGYIQPGPGGAVTSGCSDVLPTGRNFYGVDQRALPTPAAWETGRALGDLLIERYVAEEGRYPESVGIVLWAGSNMRSHGQCIAQFLYLLGVEPVWQQGTLRICGLAVIEADLLKRPRIDVTGRISGLLRDTMPAAVAWLDEAVQLVAALDEPDDINYVRKHIAQDSEQLEAKGLEREQARRQAGYRIFGDCPGAYGAGVGALLDTKNWNSIDDLGAVYVRWGGYAYGGDAGGCYVPAVFSSRMASLDVTVQNQDNREISMLSSDDYNAYHGGMIAAVRSLKGQAPKSYCGDSSQPAQPVVRSVQEETKRLFRGEAVNPKFIAGMRRHGYKGAADLANYVAHSYHWDVSSGVLEDWMYQQYAEEYALNKDMQAWLQSVNPWALQRIAETLLEAAQRKLWKASPAMQSELAALYLSIEGELEERSDD